MAFDLQNYMDTATLVERSVDVFNKAGLIGRLEQWRRRMDAYDVLHPSTGEPTLDEREALLSDPANTVREELEAEGEELLAELQASKTTWFFGALTTDDVEDIHATFPMPHYPFKPLDIPLPTGSADSTEKKAEAYLTALKAYIDLQEAHRLKFESSPEAEQYLIAVQKVRQDRAALKITKAFRRIEQDGEAVSTSLTEDQAKHLAKAFGDVVLQMMDEAIDEASREYVDLSADFLPSNSAPTQDS